MAIPIIGPVIRQLREENGQSLEELAGLVGVDFEKLARIENNQALPSLGLLIKLSRALGPKGARLSESQELQQAVITRADAPADQRHVLTGKNSSDAGHLQVWQLAADKPGRRMEPLLIEVAPLSVKNQRESEVNTEEFLYVLSGTVKLYYGDTSYELKAGDSIYYEASVPHSLGNESSVPARVLVVIYTPY